MEFLLATGAAVFFGLNTLPAKRLTDRGWNESSVVWGNFAVRTLILLIPALILARWEFRAGFFTNFAFGVVGNFFAFTIYYRALRKSDISIVMPLVSLSPLFMLITSRVMLDEVPSKWGYFAVALIVIGAYMLGCSRDRTSLTAPLRALWRDAGARMALVVSMIWSVTSNLDKRCVLASDPLTYLLLSGVTMTVLFFPIVLFRDRGRSFRDGSAWGDLMLLGALDTAMVICQMSALIYLPAPYVIAIKRSGLLVGIFAGFLRGESGMKWRVGGGILVLIGVVTIVLGG